MATKIFQSIKDFCSREDKTLNGVSPNFAKIYPDFEDMNKTNSGCWNCIDCSHCTDCMHICKGSYEKGSRKYYTIHDFNCFSYEVGDYTYFTKGGYVYRYWYTYGMINAGYHEQEVCNFSGSFSHFYKIMRRCSNTIKKKDILCDFYLLETADAYTLYDSEHKIVCKTTISIEDIMCIHRARNFSQEKTVDCIKNNTFNLI